MAYWLLKTEPSTYSWDDLVKAKKATWDGVANAAALKNMRTMKKGDQAIIYHTGTERAAIGIAEITSSAYPDPKEKEEKLVVFDLKPKSKLLRPITLNEFKADKFFTGWDLLRIGRLSVVPVPEPIWKKIQELSKT